MPTVTITEKTRKYLDSLRKNSPTERVPNTKKIVELVLDFIKNNESEFLDSLRSKKNGAQ